MMPKGAAKTLMENPTQIQPITFTCSGPWKASCVIKMIELNETTFNRKMINTVQTCKAKGNFVNNVFNDVNLKDSDPNISIPSWTWEHIWGILQCK